MLHKYIATLLASLTLTCLHAQTTQRSIEFSSLESCQTGIKTNEMNGLLKTSMQFAQELLPPKSSLYFSRKVFSLNDIAQNYTLSFLLNQGYPLNQVSVEYYPRGQINPLIMYYLPPVEAGNKYDILRMFFEFTPNSVVYANRSIYQISIDISKDISGSFSPLGYTVWVNGSIEDLFIGMKSKNIGYPYDNISIPVDKLSAASKTYALVTWQKQFTTMSCGL